MFAGRIFVIVGVGAALVISKDIPVTRHTLLERLETTEQSR